MPHDARDIANFLIDRASTQHLQLTHLSLQKILYFAHGWHLAKFDLPLLAHKFEAWQYGPVVRVVYDQLKFLKSRPINMRLVKLDINSGRLREADYNLTTEEKKFLDNIFDYFSRFHAGKLVDLTHESGGPWEKVWKKAEETPNLGMFIPDELIRVWILREGGSEDIAHH